MVVASVQKATHPLYTAYTKFSDGGKSFGAIQQRYNETLHCTWWGPIDKDLIDKILDSPYFDEFWEDTARSSGLDHVIEIRRIMWALHMKPLPRELWETKF